MRRTEGVVHIHISQRSKFFREGRIVGLFLGVEAQILQQQHLAGLKLPGHCSGHFADAVGRKGHVDLLAQFLAQQGAQPVNHRAQRVLHIRLALGTPQVRGQNHLRLAP